MKFFIVALAVLSICAFNSEAMYRKCFPVVPPVNTPTTAHPATTNPADTSPAASTVDPALLASLIAAINNGSINIQNNQNQIAQSVNTLKTSLSLVSSLNTNPNATIMLNGATATINRLSPNTATARRKRQTSFTFWTPTTCSDIVNELTALNTYAQTLYGLSGTSGIITMLNQVLTAINTTFTQLAPLAPTISTLITQLSTNTFLGAQVASNINSLTALLTVMQPALCANAPSTTTSSFSGSTLTFTPTCSYNTITYANDTTINGIYAGIGIDKQPLYVGYKTISGLNYPGGVESVRSVVPGLYYTRNGAVFALEFSSVTYLQNGPSCGCYFIPSTSPIPTGGYLVTVNSGANVYGFGVYTDSSTLSYSYQVVGRINPYNNVMYFFDALTLSEKSTTNYKKLVCVSGTVTTTTVPTTTTPNLMVNINQTRDALQILIAQNYAILSAIKDDTTAVIGTISDCITAGNLLTSAQNTALSDTLNGLKNIAFPTLTAPSFPIVQSDWCNSVQNVINAIPVAINSTTAFFDGLHQIIGLMQNVLSTNQVSLSGIGTMIDTFQGIIIAGTISTYVGDFANLLNNFNQITTTYAYFKSLFATSTCNLSYYY